MTEPCPRCGRQLGENEPCACPLPPSDAERAEAAERLRRYRVGTLAPAAAKAEAERLARIRKAAEDIARPREPGEDDEQS